MKLVVSALILGFLAVHGKSETPTWSPTYTLKGTLFIPTAEIAEPIDAWYDEPGKQSRIDYYGGMVRTYQLGNTGQYGVNLKIVPESNEEVLNKKVCIGDNGSDKRTIGPQTILPSLEDFEFISGEIFNGISAEKWQLVDTDGEKKNTYTMWLYYKINPENTDEKVTMPLRYDMAGYNTLTGSHYDHYYLDYEFFDPTVSSDAFDTTGLDCEGLPESDESRIYTFNPMAEFIRPQVTDHVHSEFQKFIETHEKTYESDLEHMSRKETFTQNMRFIHSHNRKNRSYKLAVNHLADKTDSELKASRGLRHSGRRNNAAPFPHTDINSEDLPESFDWRLYGAVNPVKDQSVCGSCWAFGTVGAMEGAYFLKTGQRVAFSEQSLIDCSWGFGNNGCDGGEDFLAYEWILKHSIPTTEVYGPYLGEDGYCRYNLSETVKISSYVEVPPRVETALRYAIVNKGPISVAVDASSKAFTFYSEGVFVNPTCGSAARELNHIVLAIGYGTMDGQNYWLLKNSWSPYWGNGGYMVIASENNQCGIMTQPSYVVL